MITFVWHLAFDLHNIVQYNNKFIKIQMPSKNNNFIIQNV